MPISTIVNKIVLTFLSTIFFCSTPAFAAYVLTTQPINFGGILVSPIGALIEIDARSGVAKPSVLIDGKSILDGNGISGRIRIFADKSYQTITLIFPESVILQELPAGPATVTMDRMADRSMISETSTEAGQILDFHLGGRLRIGRGQSGNFEGTMTITINIHNP